MRAAWVGALKAALMGLLTTAPRRVEPELMDDPAIDPAEHLRALAALQRLNRASRTGQSLWSAIAAFAAADRPLRVLDIACGGGDVARAIHQLGRAAGVDVHVTGADISPTAVAHATQAGGGPRYIQLDALDSCDTRRLRCNHQHTVPASPASRPGRALAWQDGGRSEAGRGDQRLGARSMVQAYLLAGHATDDPLTHRACGRDAVGQRGVHAGGDRSAGASRRPPRRNSSQMLAGAVHVDLEQAMNTLPRPVSTLTLADVTAMSVDVLVIGAGPGGITAALAARQGGLRVLVVDRASFPRTKVCGCCLNSSALAAFEQLGARAALEACSPDRLSHLNLAAVGRASRVRCDSGIAISRSAMDAALLELAIGRGVDFIDSTRATVGKQGVLLTGVDGPGASVTIKPGVTVAAGGLQSSATSRPAAKAGSRMGVGAVLPADARFERGTVYMACAKEGYVGAVRLEDGTLNVAGAFDAAAIRRAGGVGAAVQRVMAEAGVGALTDVEQAHWRGTPALTRQREQVWQPGVLFVGDAAGYVEPLTGQGMAWAAQGGLAAGRLIAGHRAAWSSALASRWQRVYDRNVRRSWLRCRALSCAVRSPGLTRMAVSLLGVVGRRVATPNCRPMVPRPPAMDLTRSTAT
jgi:flavin-dependent dehydrogenase